MSEAIPLADYEISEFTGYAQELPDSLPEYYKPWHDLANKTANLIASQTVRIETEKLPLLDSSKLQDFKDLRLAHLQLSIITAGYAWEFGPHNVAQSIPACVSIPLCDVSDRLEVQPGMSYFVLMGNWQRVDKQKPYSRENTKARYILPGGQQFVDFLILAVAMEINFATAFPTIQAILNSSKDGDAVELAKALRSLSQWLKGFKEISKDFHKIMEPDVFFRVIIACFRGFNETSGLPDGMLYEGVTKQPRRLVINSAASQAAVFQIIDTLLRTEYPPEKVEFFKNLRSSWSNKHRLFLERLQTWPGNVREMAEKGSNEDLTQAYNELVEAIKEFRTYHLQLVTKFMVIPNKRVRNEFNVQEPDQLANLMPLLKGIRDDSAKGRIDI